MDHAKILLIDDDVAFLELFCPLCSAQGFDVKPLESAQDALDLLEKETVDLIITDVQMPGMSGTELFRTVQDTYPDIPVILITAFGSAEKAIQAVKQGAFHYFEKPIFEKLDLFWVTVREALAKRRMLKELASLRREKSFQVRTPAPIIGQSEGIRNVLRAVEEVALLPVNVLISGETGTGKELVARAIHQNSDRRDKPFIAVNCNEFAAGILESELFGHEKGAFTGAVSHKAGLFEVGHEGTIFLDEIGNAPEYFQSKLLRVLETRAFMRVGGIESVSSNFRLLSATNRNLEEDIETGRFRRDLFYRLNVFPIQIPPLRHRREDIPLIAEFYFNRFRETYGLSIDGISTQAMLFLRKYDWPGNVRELVNIIERAVITCKDPMITTKHLFLHGEEYEEISDLNLKDAEKFFIDMALRRTNNNKTQAAELLGISRKTLIEKVKQYGAPNEVNSTK